jgi:hypothetical protein
MPQSIQELVEQSQKIIRQSRALREAVKDTKSNSIRAVAHAKAIRDSMIEQEKRKRK